MAVDDPWRCVSLRRLPDAARHAQVDTVTIIMGIKIAPKGMHHQVIPKVPDAVRHAPADILGMQ